MRYYLDEDLSPRIAIALRKQGVDAVSVHEFGGQGLSDAEHLRRAVANRRCLATRNRDDFVRLTLGAFERLDPHYGVLIVPYSFAGDAFGRIAAAMTKVARAHYGA